MRKPPPALAEGVSADGESSSKGIQLTHAALVQKLNTRRKTDEWKEAQKQRLESADTALETSSAKLKQRAGDIQGYAGILQRWLDDQQQSAIGNGALSAGMRM